MYAGIGIHLGWGIAQIVIFSGGPLGKQLYVQLPSQPVHVSYFAYGMDVFLPILSALGISFLLLRKMGSGDISSEGKLGINSR